MLKTNKGSAKPSNTIRKKQIIIVLITLALVFIFRNAYVHVQYNRIYNEIDKWCGLEDESIPTDEKLNLIRDWCYHNTVFAGGRDSLIKDPYDIRSFSPTLKGRMCRIYRLRDNLSGGFFCDGIANSLVTTYRVLGYDAYRIDVDVDGNTHCMAVVNCDGEWLVEDSTFNYCFVNEGDLKPASIDSIIESLDSGEDSHYDILEGKTIDAYAASTIRPEGWNNAKYPMIEVVSNRNDRYLYLIDRRIKYYGDLDKMLDTFEKDGYKRDYKYVLKYINNIVRFYSISDIIDYKETMEQVQAVYALCGKE